jgi:SP family arabinose:H+ symporter-like MFS transporter
MKLNSYLLKASIVGALGGLLFGFDTAVIAGTTNSLQQIFDLTPWTLGITVSIALWGTVVGALSAGVIGQRLGGRNALRIMAVLYIVSSLGCAIAWNWPALVVFRFIGGLGIGGSSVLAPVYIAELAPASLRGRLVGMFQINVVLGILLAYFSNYCIARLGLGALEWRWQLGVAAAPALLFFFMLFGIPQSPRWLATQHRIEESGRVLQLLGSSDYQAELTEIVNSIHVENAQGSEPLFSRKYRFPIFLALAVGIFNQLAGINAILYYLPSIFMAAGFSKISGDLQSVAIGAMNLFATLLFMSVIDKLGRKTLLLIGSAGTALCLSGVAFIFFTHRNQGWLVWILVGYIFFFAPLGAVIWVYLGEVFPNTVRSKGQSLGCSAHWIMNALISALFPVAAKVSGAYPFVFFAAMMVAQFFVVALFFPETKGFTLEEMQYRLGIDQNPSSRLMNS